MDEKATFETLVNTITATVIKRQGWVSITSHHRITTPL